MSTVQAATRAVRVLNSIHIIDLNAPGASNVHLFENNAQKMMRQRPRETEADLIADALPLGAVYHRNFMDLFEDDIRCAGDSMGENHPMCCPAMRFTPELMLQDWQAVYDPTIVF